MAALEICAGEKGAEEQEAIGNAGIGGVGLGGIAIGAKQGCGEHCRCVLSLCSGVAGHIGDLFFTSE